MTIQTIKPIAFVFSLGCLLGLLVINISLLVGEQAPFEPSFVQLFFALFPLWVFTIFFLNKTTNLRAEDLQGVGYFQKLRLLIGNPPTWAWVLLCVIYLYALYNMFLLMKGGIVDPEYVNGQYQINNHGTITTYTEAEYHALHNLHLRSITGLLLAFFAVSVVVFAPWRKEG